MVIQIDTRQQAKPHNINIEKYFKQNNIDTVRSKCLVGDYVIANKGNVSVDTKQDIGELYQDLITEHDRFRNECQLAKRCGIKLFVLIPNNNGITRIEDLPTRWENPQTRIYHYRQMHGQPVASKPPVDNVTLCKIMKTMQAKYGVSFVFCPSNRTGEILVSLLTSNPIQNTF